MDLDTRPGRETAQTVIFGKRVWNAVNSPTVLVGSWVDLSAVWHVGKGAEL